MLKVNGGHVINRKMKVTTLYGILTTHLDITL
jgi:hypothetical protein